MCAMFVCFYMLCGYELFMRPISLPGLVESSGYSHMWIDTPDYSLCKLWRSEYPHSNPIYVLLMGIK